MAKTSQILVRQIKRRLGLVKKEVLKKLSISTTEKIVNTEDKEDKKYSVPYLL
jgi:hypothetical protein